jgi:membrane protease YdiL (CAAX protease family)
MAGVQVWTRTGPARLQPLTGPVAAAAVVLLGAAAGRSRSEMGFGGDPGRGARYAVACAGPVVVAYAIAALIPATRRVFGDTRHRLSAGSALYTALVAVPLATVLFEEVAFRGVLWSLLAHRHGALRATVVSSALFGLWHVASATDLARARPGAEGRSAAGRHGRVPAVLGTVAFTGAAGAVLTGLRLAGGNLLAPVALHWATNGLGVLTSAWVWAARRE